MSFWRAQEQTRAVPGPGPDSTGSPAHAPKLQLLSQLLGRPGEPAAETARVSLWELQKPAHGVTRPDGQTAGAPPGPLKPAQVSFPPDLHLPLWKMEVIKASPLPLSGCPARRMALGGGRISKGLI